MTHMVNNNYATVRPCVCVRVGVCLLVCLARAHAHAYVYTRPNEQPVVCFSLHIDDLTCIAHALKRHPDNL